MSFSHILGQERVIKILRRFLASNRFPQGLLFFGPSGVGKRTVALELAKALNCQTQITADTTRRLAQMNTTPMSTDACDRCSSCQKIDKNIHPDVKIISPEKETIGIDQIRELNREVQWKPFEGKYKVYILEKAEKLTQEAANSFLKTLEEPPTNVFFILLSENKDTLLPTILSRCWALPFSGLSGKVVHEILHRPPFPISKEILLQENFFAGRIQEVILSKNFFTLYQKIEKFWQNIFSEEEILNLSQDWSKDKNETAELLTLFLLLARDKGDWQAVEFINQAKNQIQRNLNRRLVLDCLLLKLKSLCR